MNRYISVEPGQTGELNRLLLQGWSPVRELVAGDDRGSVLVLLEKPDFPAGSVEFPGLGTVDRQQLSGFTLLQGLGDEELSDIAACCESRLVSAGASVFEEGQPGTALYFLIDGRVSLQLAGLPLEDAEILAVGPGDVFGESTFFSPGPHSIRAIAVSDLQLLVLERERYDQLLQSGNAAAGKLGVNAAELLGTRLQETDQWMKAFLEEEQNAEIAASWRRFRRGVSGSSSESTGGFFHA